MGELLYFPIERVRRPAPTVPATPSFYFDVSDPFCYLTAERVERTLGEVEWVAVDGAALNASIGSRRTQTRAATHLRAAAQERADALRLPLVWPEHFPARTPGALRAADLACELGAGAAFALALHRLAFCGGFELDDPEVLAEAAAAAGVPLGACLEAAGEEWRDANLTDRAVRLREAGIESLPAFCVAGRWLSGEQGLAAADAVRRERDRELLRSPYAPAG